MKKNKLTAEGKIRKRIKELREDRVPCFILGFSKLCAWLPWVAT